MVSQFEEAETRMQSIKRSWSYLGIIHSRVLGRTKNIEKRICRFRIKDSFLDVSAILYYDRKEVDL